MSQDVTDMGQIAIGIRDSIYRHRGELILVGLITVITCIMYVETFSMMAETRMVPRFVLYLTFAAIGLFVLDRGLGPHRKHAIANKISSVIPSRDEPLLIGSSVEGQEIAAEVNQEVDLYDIDIFSAIPKLIWIAAYLLGIVYVGYFTWTSLFVAAYILRYYESSSMRRRIVVAVVAVLVTTALSYLLFVRFLLIYDLFDFGFLP